MFRFKVLANGDANTLVGQHRSGWLVIGMSMRMAAPTVCFGIGSRKVALIDKVQPVATGHITCIPVNPTFVDLRTKVDAPCNHVWT